MGFLSIIRKSRYSLNPTHFNATCLFSAISSNGSPLNPQNCGSVPSKSYLFRNFPCGSHLFYHSDAWNNTFLRNYCGFRLFSTIVTDNNDNNIDDDGDDDSGQCNVVKKSDGIEGSNDQISEIVDVVRNDGGEMENVLDCIGYKLSRDSIIEILSVLNKANVPALRFFRWVRAVYPLYSRNADICSLVVDNCGRLGDSCTMISVLKDFRDKKICLSWKAFGFLKVSRTDVEGAKKSVAAVVGVLDVVGGSCRSSGIVGLIQMLCDLNLIDLVRFVMDISERKASYYNVLMKHMCVKGQFKSAQNVLLEMRRLGCEPDSTAYNYLISTLCKQGGIDQGLSVFREMLDTGCYPDHITYEILIYFACKDGRSDQAVMLYSQMVSRGIKPRLPTHGSFIRGYFSSQRFEEAYRYVVDTSAVEPWTSQQVYVMLASLHIQDGDLLVAHKLLVEMIEKGLLPKHSVYRRASNRLRQTGMSELAKSLNTLYSGLRNLVIMKGDQPSVSSM